MIEASAIELAALYVSGSLSPDARESFETQIREGNEAYARALAELAPVGETLMSLIEPVEPESVTRTAVLDQASDPGHGAGRQVWRDWTGDTQTDALFTLRRDDGAWEETGVEGIRVRRLFVDTENNRMTALFRMAAGSEYIPHVHSGPEECYVLEGDLHVGDDLVMYAGDYQRAAAGSEHGVQRTEGGCLILVTSAIDDEVI